MAVLKLTRHINAPRSIVFALATDVSAWANQAAGDERIEMLTEGPLRIGSRFRKTRKIFGHASVEVIEVTGLDAPNRLTRQAKTSGALLTIEYKFLPDISGTLVELTVGAKARSVVSRLLLPLAWLLRRPWERMLEAELESLKRVAEERAAAQWQTDPVAAIQGYETSGA
jgi:hypothetical protein